jgi:hypothetical protein
MKEIIAKGTDRYRASCSECGTVFTYEREDVHHNYVLGGDWVSCPHCGHSHRHFGAGKWDRGGSGCDMSVRPLNPYRGWSLGPPVRGWD